MSHAPRIFNKLALLTIAAAVTSGSASAQVRVSFSTDAEMNRTWRVTSATVDEGPLTVGGSISVQNITSAPVGEARFYAEYFDAAERLCFTLAYASEVTAAN